MFCRAVASSNGLFILLEVKAYQSRVLRDQKLAHTIAFGDWVSKGLTAEQLKL